MIHWATVKEAAGVHRLPLPTLYRWLSKGWVRSHGSKVGTLVDLDSLDSHLATRALDKRMPS